MCDFSFTESFEYKNFISTNEKADTFKLRLKKFKDMPFDTDFAIKQIECRQKVNKKLPSLCNELLYPTNLSIEQCTSEAIAQFHASLFKGCENVIDFTCGLGIDSYFISKAAKNLTSIELNPGVASVVAFNFRKLNADNITVANADSEIFAKTIPYQKFAGFIDPSRRDKSDCQHRIFGIKDCTPNLDIMIDHIKNKCDFLIVKASPMVDITQTLKEYPQISDIWIISIKNECKELLFKLNFKNHSPNTYNNGISITTIDFEQEKTVIYDVKTNDLSPDIMNATPEIGNLLFIPNSSILKSGLYGKLCSDFNLRKIATNSNIFIGNNIVPEFPGRIFGIIGIYTMAKKGIKDLRSKISSANVACRNFHLSPDELLKRLKIKEGGNDYIFATTTHEQRQILLLCKKINA